MSVTLEIGFENKPPQATRQLPVVYGGIRVEIDGCELTRYRNQNKLAEEAKERDQYEVSWFNESGNELPVDPYYFKGEYLTVDLSRVCEAFIEGTQLCPEEYREVSASLEATSSEVIFSYIDDEKIRVAFQARNRNKTTRKPVTEAARGYVVSKTAFRSELVSCNKSIVSYLENMRDVEDVHELMIRDLKNEVQSTIESLERS